MKILVIEENSSIRNFTKLLPKELDHEVISSNEDNFLKNLELENLSIIILDMDLDSGNSAEVLKSIRNFSYEIIVIIVSEKENFHNIKSALQLHANNFLMKPFTDGKLEEILIKYDSLLKKKSLKKEIISMVTEKQISMEITNDLAKIPEIVNFLINTAFPFLDKSKHLEVSLGLNELLINAVEHGNLGISFEEKRDLLNNNEVLSTVILKKMKNKKLANKKIRIEFKGCSKFCQWTIKDEGQGFDYDKWFKKNADHSNINGRGIILSKFQFNEMEYFEGGKSVRVLMENPENSTF